MNRRNALTALILSSVLSMAAGSVRAATGGAIVTDAWAGVWDVYEQTYQATSDCGGVVVIRTHSFRDTLCTGEEFSVFSTSDWFGSILSPGCSGDGFTATALHLRCDGNGIYPCPGNSTVHQTLEANWTLSGDFATTVVTNTMSVTSGYPGCYGTTCTKTTGTRTRVSDGAAACGAVPTRRQTWGKLKLLYR